MNLLARNGCALEAEQIIPAVLRDLAQRLVLVRQGAMREPEKSSTAQTEHWGDDKIRSYLRFRDLLEAAPDAILEADRDGPLS